MIQIRAHDGFLLEAYLAKPDGLPRGSVVIAQEMYGVNDYLRSVCDFFASHGYLSIAPALYDRQQRRLEFSYTEEAHDRAQKAYRNWDWNLVLDDLDAARLTVADGKKAGIVGFCAGGSLAWLAACRRSYSCAIAYYGSLMPDYANEQPRCPVIAHVGENDTSFPRARVESFRAVHSDVPIFLYPGARHGFDNPKRVDRYHAEAATTARKRTLEFLAAHVG